MRRLQESDLPEEKAQKFKEKLAFLEGKLSPEEVKWAKEHCKEAQPHAEGQNFPYLRFRARKIQKKLILENEMSPDERKELEAKFAKIRSRMNQEDLAQLEQDTKELNLKKEKRQKKHAREIEGHITERITQAAPFLARMMTPYGDKPERGCKKLKFAVEELVEALKALPEDKQKEIDGVLKGTVVKLVAAAEEKQKWREEKRKWKEGKHRHSKSKSKSRSKSKPKTEEKTDEHRAFKSKHHFKHGMKGKWVLLAESKEEKTQKPEEKSEKQEEKKEEKPKQENVTVKFERSKKYSP